MRCLKKLLLKKDSVQRRLGKWQLMTDFSFVWIMETLHVTGLVILIFIGLPQLDSTHSLVLTNCMAFVPSLLLLCIDLKRNWLLTFLDVLAIISQMSGFLLWPLLNWTNTTHQEKELTDSWAVLTGEDTIVLTYFISSSFAEEF